MNCDTVREQLADYLGRELAPAAHAAVDAHLDGCPDCRAEVTSLEGTIAALRRLDVPPVSVPSAPPRRTTWRPPFAYAATLLIGLGVGWWAKPSAAPPAAPADRPAAVDVERKTGGMHHAWIAAAESSAPNDASPFARNAVRLVRALSSGRQ